MTGWIKVTDGYGPVYVNVDRINFVTESQGVHCSATDIDMGDSALYVEEPIDEVLKAIELARPTRT